MSKNNECYLCEMKDLMTEKKDFNSMRLPRSFANTQADIYLEEDLAEAKMANNPINPTE